MSDSQLEVYIANLRLRNPLMLASGILDETGKTMERVARIGVGAIVTKSVGIEPRMGNRNPTVVTLDNGLINAMGLPNPGIDEFEDEIEHAKKGNVPLIGSIFGNTANEYAYLAKKMESYGVDGLELNLSCPHAKGTGVELGADTKLISKIVKKVRDSTKLPVFVKLSPMTHDIVALGLIAEKSGASGIVAINTIRAMKIDVTLMRPVLSNIYGGLSGSAIRPIGVRCVYELYENLKIPIIGVGGIENWNDVIEYILAGAQAVQIGTSIWKKGLNIFKKINKDLKIYLRKNKLSRISDIVGYGHVK